jgi:hypothetical protein
MRFRLVARSVRKSSAVISWSIREHIDIARAFRMDGVGWARKI